MKFRDGKAMKGERVNDKFKIGLVYGEVWAALYTLHKHILEEIIKSIVLFSMNNISLLETLKMT